MESQIVSKRDSKHIEFCDSWDPLKSWYILGWSCMAVLGVENDFSWFGSIQLQIVVRWPLIDMSKFGFATICITRQNYQTSIVGELSLWHAVTWIMRLEVASIDYICRWSYSGPLDNICTYCCKDWNHTIEVRAVNPILQKIDHPVHPMFLEDTLLCRRYTCEPRIMPCIRP